MAATAFQSILISVVARTALNSYVSRNQVSFCSRIAFELRFRSFGAAEGRAWGRDSNSLSLLEP
jgi:hypothetical protein